jgi:hypothetical protein
MSKARLLTFMTSIMLFCSCEQLSNIEGIGDLGSIGGSTALSNEEVISGLKEALSRGAEKAANLASVTDGFYKNQLLYIVFPEDAQRVKDKALALGLDAQVEKFELTLNRAAEEAAKEAAPVFLNAVKGMTVQDGFAILNGGENSATNFLKQKTTAELNSKFGPIVSQAIDKVELTKYWDPLANAYNATTLLTGGEKVETDLNAYVTGKAIDGLFVHIAAEEKNIRQNPQARVSELLKRVFGS